MKTKGQVTIFVIIGIIILGIGLVLININRTNTTKDLSSEKPSSETSSFDHTAVQNYIENCLQITAAQSIKEIAKQGGYHTLPQNSDLGNKVPLYLQYSELQIPTKARIETELATSITQNIPSCLKEFNTFKRQGIIVKVNSIQTTSTLLENKVIIELNMPTSIESTSIFELSDFKIEENTELLNIYTAANQYTTEQVEYTQDICLTCLTKLTIPLSLNPSILEIAPNRYLIVFQSKFENLTFMFEHDYSIPPRGFQK